LAARFVRDEEAAGSNPATPTARRALRRGALLTISGPDLTLRGERSGARGGSQPVRGDAMVVAVDLEAGPGWGAQAGAGGGAAAVVPRPVLLGR
jgi:hypothetical protein